MMARYSRVTVEKWKLPEIEIQSETADDTLCVCAQ